MASGRENELQYNVLEKLGQCFRRQCCGQAVCQRSLTTNQFILSLGEAGTEEALQPQSAFGSASPEELGFPGRGTWKSVSTCDS